MNSVNGNEVREVMVSQGTREMARPPEYHEKRLQEHYADLVKHKLEIQNQLGAYDKASEFKLQQKTRRETPGLDAWISVKADFYDKKKTLVIQMRKLDEELSATKKRLTTINIQNSHDKNKDEVRQNVWPLILYELREIKALMRAHLDQKGGGDG